MGKIEVNLKCPLKGKHHFTSIFAELGYMDQIYPILNTHSHSHVHILDHKYVWLKTDLLVIN